MKKIAFLCLPGLTTFIEPITDYFEAKGHPVRRVYTGAGHVLTNALEWADVIWIEWANELAITLTNTQNIDQLKKKMIVRLHSYEALTSMAKRVNWQPVTDLIFVADHVKRYVQKTVDGVVEICDFSTEPGRTVRRAIHVIPNGVKVDQIPFKDRKYDEAWKRGIKFCSLSHMSNKKGPMLLLHAFLELDKIFDCTLHVGGNWQDERYLYYYNWMIKELELEKKVFLDGNIGNVPQWLEDKYAILCTSPWESQNLGIMEAMCCGVQPFIHNFPGAKEIYKPEWCWSSFDDLVELFKYNTGTSQQYRDYIKENYDFNDQIKKIEEVIDG